jgi:predicted short-subunit dehydrogenase-like oxidoreductase (DUF2520 family)
METISFIGSGNVATHLAKAFFAKGYTLLEICSPTPGHACRLAGQVHAEAVTQIEKLRPADIFIIAVNDSAIVQVATQLPVTGNFVLHTAGSVDISVLQKFPNYGILYPLQTLCHSSEINMAAIPFFIEANLQKNLEKVYQLAKSLSEEVQELDSAHRARLHLAAVFANNFVNSLLEIAHNIAGADFKYLEPLVYETARKAFNAECPAKVQTGPARRGDKDSIKKHMETLSSYPEGLEVYRLMSEIIITQAKTWSIKTD